MAHVVVTEFACTIWTQQNAPPTFLPHLAVFNDCVLLPTKCSRNMQRILVILTALLDVTTTYKLDGHLRYCIQNLLMATPYLQLTQSNQVWPLTQFILPRLKRQEQMMIFKVSRQMTTSRSGQRKRQTMNHLLQPLMPLKRLPILDLCIWYR